MNQPSDEKAKSTSKVVWLLVVVLLLIAVGILLVFLSKQNNLLFENSDFEQGSLKNWQIISGDAFLNQPTLDDNVAARKRGVAGLKGHYWIGTYEARRSSNAAPGTVQGDKPVGVLRSTDFVIKKDTISFLVGAGNGSDSETVALFVANKPVLVARPNAFPLDGKDPNPEQMKKILWTVSQWKNSTARIEITDNSSGGWGHINCDDFTYEEK